MGRNIPERIAVTDWLWNLCSYCAKKEFSLFFLGTTQKVIEKAAKKLIMKLPNLIIKGTHHGFFNKDGYENNGVIDLINKAKPDILIVSFGMPLQEKWLKDNWEKLDAKVFLVGGACFDYASGYLRRGPKLLANNGLEWFCRLLIEPRRLWQRYLIGNAVFFIQIVKEAVLKKSFYNLNQQ
jgi:N-acetylglucosaminyldiphosphoundecaprenol N-acetyl-beta-D-mannosaminyltransferase